MHLQSSLGFTPSPRANYRIAMPTPTTIACPGLTHRLVVWLASAIAALLLISAAHGQPAEPESLPTEARSTELTRELLDEAIALARHNLLAIQTERGDFVYEFDFTTDEELPATQPARQASGVWGLTLLHLDHPSEETRAAALAGIRFFQKNSLPCEQGSCVVYPATSTGRTTTQALVCLAEIDFLRAEIEGETADEVRGYLDEHLAYLASLQMENGHFCSEYNYVTGQGFAEPNPYADGEALLAIAKAAAYLGYEELIPHVLRGAEVTWQDYFATPRDAGDDTTPFQFYQWGSLTYFEIYRAGWPGGTPYAERTIEMGHWVREKLLAGVGDPQINQAVIYEGLNPALALAELSGDTQSQTMFHDQVSQGMLGALAFQVGNSQASDFLRAHPPVGERAMGGCQWFVEDTTLRIDGVVHQLHALLQTRQLLFPEPAVQPVGVQASDPAETEPAEAPAVEEAGEEAPTELTRELLDESIAMAQQHMLGVQLESGDFFYQFDYITGFTSGGNNQVRQAGGLWAVALLQLAGPSEENRAAVLRGIRFFHEHSRPAEAGGRFITYPGNSEGKTGTVALLALAEIEFLRSEPAGETYDEVASYLNDHLDFLLTLQFEDGRFHCNYDYETGAGTGLWSPYFDGESLLALSKAAAYVGRDDLVPNIMHAAESMWYSYVRLPIESNDKRTPTQFYQWGSMAFYEIYKAGWEGSEPYAERVIDMAHDRLLEIAHLSPEGNYASRYEGLGVAWEVARLSGDVESQELIGQQIHRGVLGLLSFQVGNPLQNEFIQSNPPGSEVSLGGCLMRADNPNLRIDCVQHQVHALLLTRRFLFGGP